MKRISILFVYVFLYISPAYAQVEDSSIGDTELAEKWNAFFNLADSAEEKRSFIERLIELEGVQFFSNEQFNKPQSAKTQRLSRFIYELSQKSDSWLQNREDFKKTITEVWDDLSLRRQLAEHYMDFVRDSEHRVTLEGLVFLGQRWAREVIHVSDSSGTHPDYTELVLASGKGRVVLDVVDLNCGDVNHAVCSGLKANLNDLKTWLQAQQNIEEDPFEQKTAWLALQNALNTELSDSDRLEALGDFAGYYEHSIAKKFDYYLSPDQIDVIVLPNLSGVDDLSLALQKLKDDWLNFGDTTSSLFDNVKRPDDLMDHRLSPSKKLSLYITHVEKQFYVYRQVITDFPESFFENGDRPQTSEVVLDVNAQQSFWNKLYDTLADLDESKPESMAVRVIYGYSNPYQALDLFEAIDLIESAYKLLGEEFASTVLISRKELIELFGKEDPFSILEDGNEDDPDLARAKRDSSLTRTMRARLALPELRKVLQSKLEESLPELKKVWQILISIEKLQDHLVIWSFGENNEKKIHVSLANQKDLDTFLLQQGAIVADLSLAITPGNDFAVQPTKLVASGVTIPIPVSLDSSVIEDEIITSILSNISTVPLRYNLGNTTLLGLQSAMSLQIDNAIEGDTNSDSNCEVVYKEDLFNSTKLQYCYAVILAHQLKDSEQKIKKRLAVKLRDLNIDAEAVIDWSLIFDSENLIYQETKIGYYFNLENISKIFKSGGFYAWWDWSTDSVSLTLDLEPEQMLRHELAPYIQICDAGNNLVASPSPTSLCFRVNEQDDSVFRSLGVLGQVSFDTKESGLQVSLNNAGPARLVLVNGTTLTIDAVSINTNINQLNFDGVRIESDFLPVAGVPDLRFDVKYSKETLSWSIEEESEERLAESLELQLRKQGLLPQFLAVSSIRIDHHGIKPTIEIHEEILASVILGNKRTELESLVERFNSEFRLLSSEVSKLKTGAQLIYMHWIDFIKQSSVNRLPLLIERLENGLAVGEGVLPAADRFDFGSHSVEFSCLPADAENNYSNCKVVLDIPHIQDECGPLVDVEFVRNETTTVSLSENCSKVLRGQLNESIPASLASTVSYETAKYVIEEKVFQFVFTAKIEEPGTSLLTEVRPELHIGLDGSYKFDLSAMESTAINLTRQAFCGGASTGLEDLNSILTSCISSKLQAFNLGRVGIEDPEYMRSNNAVKFSLVLDSPFDANKKVKIHELSLTIDGDLDFSNAYLDQESIEQIQEELDSLMGDFVSVSLFSINSSSESLVIDASVGVDLGALSFFSIDKSIVSPLQILINTNGIQLNVGETTSLREFVISEIDNEIKKTKPSLSVATAEVQLLGADLRGENRDLLFIRSKLDLDLSSILPGGNAGQSEVAFDFCIPLSSNGVDCNDTNELKAQIRSQIENIASRTLEGISVPDFPGGKFQLGFKNVAWPLRCEDVFCLPAGVILQGTSEIQLGEYKIKLTADFSLSQAGINLLGKINLALDGRPIGIVSTVPGIHLMEVEGTLDDEFLILDAVLRTEPENTSMLKLDGSFLIGFNENLSVAAEGKLFLLESIELAESKVELVIDDGVQFKAEVLLGGDLSDIIFLKAEMLLDSNKKLFSGKGNLLMFQVPTANSSFHVDLENKKITAEGYARFVLFDAGFAFDAGNDFRNPSVLAYGDFEVVSLKVYASLLATLHAAQLDLEVFDFNLSVIVPSIYSLDQDYLIDLILSLLSLDIKLDLDELINALENFRIGDVRINAFGSFSLDGSSSDSSDGKDTEGNATAGAGENGEGEQVGIEGSSGVVASTDGKAVSPAESKVRKATRADLACGSDVTSGQCASQIDGASPTPSNPPPLPDERTSSSSNNRNAKPPKIPLGDSSSDQRFLISKQGQNLQVARISIGSETREDLLLVPLAIDPPIENKSAHFQKKEEQGDFYDALEEYPLLIKNGKYAQLIGNKVFWYWGPQKYAWLDTSKISLRGSGFKEYIDSQSSNEALAPIVGLLEYIGDWGVANITTPREISIENTKLEELSTNGSKHVVRSIGLEFDTIKTTIISYGDTFTWIEGVDDLSLELLPKSPNDNTVYLLVKASAGKNVLFIDDSQNKARFFNTNWPEQSLLGDSSADIRRGYVQFLKGQDKDVNQKDTYYALKRNANLIFIELRQQSKINIALRSENKFIQITDNNSILGTEDLTDFFSLNSENESLPEELMNVIREYPDFRIHFIENKKRGSTSHADIQIALFRNDATKQVQYVMGLLGEETKSSRVLSIADFVEGVTSVANSSFSSDTCLSIDNTEEWFGCLNDIMSNLKSSGLQGEVYRYLSQIYYE